MKSTSSSCRSRCPTARWPRACRTSRWATPSWSARSPPAPCWSTTCCPPSACTCCPPAPDWPPSWAWSATPRPM